MGFASSELYKTMGATQSNCDAAAPPQFASTRLQKPIDVRWQDKSFSAKICSNTSYLKLAELVRLVNDIEWSWKIMISRIPICFFPMGLSMSIPICAGPASSPAAGLVRRLCLRNSASTDLGEKEWASKDWDEHLENPLQMEVLIGYRQRDNRTQLSEKYGWWWTATRKGGFGQTNLDFATRQLEQKVTGAVCPASLGFGVFHHFFGS